MAARKRCFQHDLDQKFKASSCILKERNQGSASSSAKGADAEWDDEAIESDDEVEEDDEAGESGDEAEADDKVIEL